MGVTTITQEYPCSASPARFFKALVVDSQTVIPKIIPSFKSIDFIEGDGGVGSIKQTNFPEGSHYKYLKHRVDALDKDNCYTKYTLIEGDALGDTLESIVYEIKLEASGSGSVCKMTSHYHTKPGVEIKEEDIKSAKEKAMGMYKVLDDYLIANPDVCA